MTSDGGGPEFYTYDQLTAELQYLSQQFPDLVTLSAGGQSVEGRDIWTVTVGNGAKKVLVNGAIHGSEWIAAPVLVDTIKALINGYYQDTKELGQPVQYILDNYSITFIPMLNPDGVTLAQFGADAFPHLRNELLAMSPNGSDFSRWKANIRGVDLNRNFNVRWGKPVDQPVSTVPSYAFYGGPYPESEPESQIPAEWVRDNDPVLLLDYHSFGEIIFWYYLQTGSALDRDRSIVRAMRDYTGYIMEAIDPYTRPSSTLTYWGSAVAEIPSICVELGSVSPHLLSMEDVPDIFNQVKYLPLVAIMNLPGYKAHVPVQSVSLPSALELPLDTAKVLTPVFSPANATNKNVTWASSNPAVVSVDPDGTVTGLKSGNATVSLTTEDGGLVRSCHISVYSPLFRLSGANRYGTAAEISAQGWETADTVVLARGDNFADGLAGVPLARQLDAPLLLTRTSTLPAETREEIVRLQAKKVYILGGTGAISTGVRRELEALGLDVDRISGSNRFETAAEIARLLDPADTAVVVYGYNFPDALSAAAHAAANGYPILLTDQNSLPSSTTAVIKELGIKNSVAIGGTAVISSSVLNKLPNPVRVQGPNRYATSVEVNKFFGPDNSTVYVASGLEFADALAGAALAAKENCGILLTGKEFPDALGSYLPYLNPQEAILFGGPAAVPTGVEVELSQLLQQLKE